MLFLVTEVHNFGGFFGGDTVTLSGRRWGAADAAEETLTIDAAALVNVPQRHHVAADMVFCSPWLASVSSAPSCWPPPITMHCARRLARHSSLRHS
ncbi:hypothetical protein HC891_06845 [Candidatus Gracilibacteria bacterium]|nr:hypothetical protein [Candidatus Gracilibacteria bacterium]